jgi:hypothetical protein
MEFLMSPSWGAYFLFTSLDFLRTLPDKENMDAIKMAREIY